MFQMRKVRHAIFSSIPWSFTVIAVMAIYLSSAVLSFVLQQRLEPKVMHGSYKLSESGSYVTFNSFPLDLHNAPRTIFSLTASFTLDVLHARKYRMTVDDCLEYLSVNGKRIPLSYPVCDHRRGFVVDLSGIVRSGKNTIVAKVGNGGGPAMFDVVPSHFDSVSLSIPFLTVALLVSATLILCGLMNVKNAVVRIEYAFLAVFVLLRILVFVRFGFDNRGFDTNAHLEMVQLARLSNFFSMSVRTFFYSYHPPVAFLLAKGVQFFVGNPVVSINLISMGAALGAFFYMRVFLRACRLLHTYAGIAFLYVHASLPVVIYLASSINIDVLILFFATAVLHHCTSLSFERRIAVRWLHGIAATLFLVTALHTKFNAILLLPIVFFPVFFYVPKKSKSLSQTTILCHATFIFIAAITLSLPYYTFRNVAQTKMFFPANTEWVAPRELEYARRYRDRDRVAFLRKLIEPTTSVTGFPIASRDHYRSHDYETPRLWDTWKFIWISDQNPIYQSPESIAYSVAYLAVMPSLMFIGLLLWVWSLIRRRTAWDAIGVLFMFLGFASMLALANFSYNLPYASYGPTKTIYVPLITWPVAFFISKLLGAVERVKTIRVILIFFVAVFMVANHHLLVY